MAEIGAQLRETRMRNRIDISDVESETKIRAKYLRALENEEWDLLPGPTFVATFLRTYAEYLGLDARSLVERYRSQAEVPVVHDTTQFPGRMRQQRRRSRFFSPGPWLLLLLAALALAGGLYVLGRIGDDDEPARPDPTPGPAQTAVPSPDGEADRPARRGSGRVRLAIRATGDVSVCLENDRGRVLLENVTLAAGDRTETFRGRRLLVSFGTDAAVMRVDGRRYRVARAAPVGYELAPDRPPRELREGQRPTCTR